MIRIDAETLFNNESPNETLKSAYEFNGREVWIAFKKGMVQPGQYYLVEAIGKNVRLTPKEPYPVRNHPEDPRHRKVRIVERHPPCISLPLDCAKPGNLFRVIRSPKTGIIWLLRIDSFYYADETSIPPEFLKVV